MTRIEQPSSHGSRLTFVIAVIVAAGIALGSIFLGQAKEQKKITEKMRSAGLAVPSDSELRRVLTPEQYHVTRENGTETPFRNLYWDNHRPGIYVDLITGEPLFSSADKFESGTGWPSFTKPLEPNRVVEKIDRSFGTRTEIRSKSSDAHLGHVFEDGPPPSGMRYCMNSAALRFVPVEKLKEEGLGQYLPLFEARK